MLKAGEQFTLTTEEIEGDESKVSITYEGLVQDVDAGRVILIDDGLIELKVVGKSEKEIFCEVINGGELGERKGVNVPNVAVRLPAITEKDKAGAVAILSTPENKGKIAFFGGIQNCRFKGMVFPGDVLRLETKIIRQKGPVGIGKAVASVDGKVVVSAELTFMAGE